MSGHLRPSSKGKEVHHSHTVIGPRGQVQNVKAARVYVFGNDDVYEDDEQVEFEMPEMRARRGQQGAVGFTSEAQQEGETYFEKEIGDGDTLQSIALKYSCPVSELKRINNLIKDQDFFALRVLKVPMHRHGYISELLKEEAQLDKKPAGASNFHNGHTRTSDSDLPSDAYCSDVDFSDPDTQLRVIQTVSIRQNFSRQGREAERFLRKMDKDLTKIRQTTPTDHESLGEVISMLTNKSFQPLHSKKEVINGVDCGIRWWWYVIAAVTVAVLIPIIFFLYYFFFQEKNGS
ncbi:hypothetical protein BaRGS_00011843 [Batillaria attramentaria]|uniref:LysM domain-containing protein n=1 Tax=Batillaria attramentaria TaxID=370345 RepID=A0ABD0LC95_9CAEN